MKGCLECGNHFEAMDWVCTACGATPSDDEGVLVFGIPSDGPAVFPDESFSHLAGLEDRSFWFRGRNRLILWALRAYFPHARSFIDVGCGNGYVLAAVADARPEMACTGVDAHRAGLRVARARVPTALLCQVHAERLPFVDMFEVAGAFDVLEHVVDDAEVLDAIRATLVPGGGLVLTVPQHPFLWGPADTYAEHKRRYTRSQVLTLLDRGGFTVRCCTSFVSLLLPVMAVSRALQRRASGRFDPIAEHRQHRIVSALLERTLRIELGLISRGTSLPAGGSLLAVADRR